MKKVVVGMSGGVDSSVAALLLKKQGYEVIGVTMQIWQPETPEHIAAEGGCCGMSAVTDAAAVAEVLGIPHYVMNFREEFKERVIAYFTREYLQGRTPNPCIACNRYVKWESLLQRSLELGADYIATGHYANVEQLPDGRYAIRNAATARKDQTYALYSLTQEQLAHTLFPVGAYEKEEVRRMAQEAGLPVANKPDSQEICFVPDGDYAAFIEEECGGKVPPPGDFVDRGGNRIGPHKGITHYTVGQRRGLGIPAGHRIFVTELRPETDEVVLGEDAELWKRDVYVGNVSWMRRAGITEPVQVMAKIRYNHKGDAATLYPQENGEVLCRYDSPVRAATPGQACVFYEGEYVLGGGTILRAD